jgi:hypothetical protein
MRILVEDCNAEAQLIVARAIAAAIKNVSLGTKIVVSQGGNVGEPYVQKPIDTFHHELSIRELVRIVVEPSNKAFHTDEELEVWVRFAAGFAGSANNDSGGMFDTTRVAAAADQLLEAFRKRAPHPRAGDEDDEEEEPT